jgi:hypothetical protein
MAGVVIWMLIPFWGQAREVHKPRLLVTGVGVCLVAYMVVFTALGYWL